MRFLVPWCYSATKARTAGQPLRLVRTIQGCSVLPVARLGPSERINLTASLVWACYGPEDLALFSGWCANRKSEVIERSTLVPANFAGMGICELVADRTR